MENTRWRTFRYVGTRELFSWPFECRYGSKIPAKGKIDPFTDLVLLRGGIFLTKSKFGHSRPQWDHLKCPPRPTAAVDQPPPLIWAVRRSLHAVQLKWNAVAYPLANRLSPKPSAVASEFLVDPLKNCKNIIVVPLEVIYDGIGSFHKGFHLRGHPSLVVLRLLLKVSPSNGGVW